MFLYSESNSARKGWIVMSSSLGTSSTRIVDNAVATIVRNVDNYTGCISVLWRNIPERLASSGTPM
jgi:hypothetical protein